MTVISGREKDRIKKEKEKKAGSAGWEEKEDKNKTGKKRNKSGMRIFPTVTRDAIRKEIGFFSPP